MLEGGCRTKPSPDWKGGGAKPPEAGRSGSGALESGIKLGSAIFTRKFSFGNLLLVLLGNGRASLALLVCGLG